MHVLDSYYPILKTLKLYVKFLISDPAITPFGKISLIHVTIDVIGIDILIDAWHAVKWM